MRYVPHQKLKGAWKGLPQSHSSCSTTTTKLNLRDNGHVLCSPKTRVRSETVDLLSVLPQGVSCTVRPVRCVVKTHREYKVSTPLSHGPLASPSRIYGQYPQSTKLDSIEFRAALPDGQSHPMTSKHLRGAPQIQSASSTAANLKPRTISTKSLPYVKKKPRPLKRNNAPLPQDRHVCEYR